MKKRTNAGSGAAVRDMSAVEKALDQLLQRQSDFIDPSFALHKNNPPHLLKLRDEARAALMSAIRAIALRDDVRAAALEEAAKLMETTEVELPGRGAPRLGPANEFAIAPKVRAAAIRALYTQPRGGER